LGTAIRRELKALLRSVRSGSGQDMVQLFRGVTVLKAP
jgi:hypothetical protein